MAIEGYSLETIPQFVGRDLGVSSWTTITQEHVNQFAECTGDGQWIHIDVERAQRESPFGGTIAHGCLTLSLLPPMQTEVGVVPAGVSRAMNYGFSKVRFLSPVRVGVRVRDRVVLLSAEDKGKGRFLLTTQNTLEIEGEEKPALTAESMVLLT
ncbi:MAG: MaoC family dehydratase [Gammaproteobacteria bacterium]|nr:MaoC family dehydratase [Gammaproteobacteria bacterium]MCP5458274.1 MaoC family dehydratase [Gammaproteobacteria bacterium]